MSTAVTGRRAPASWICRACSSSLRPYTTSATRSSSVPPESPKFLQVPLPPQKFVTRKRVIKGKLPVPKDVFAKKTKAIASPAWLDAATPEPKPKSKSTEQDAQMPTQARDPDPRTLWKTRMSSLRRQNLREGVLELHERRRQTSSALQFRSRRRSAEQAARVNAPVPDYETLTRPSVNEVLRDVFKRDHGWQGAPVSERRANFEAHQSAKLAERRDALHTLYMHARHFITTEEQLDKAVEDAFTNPDGSAKTNSIWEDKGTRPFTTDEMLASTRGADANLAREDRASGRMRKLAEELTGGKIADEWTSGRL